MKECLQSSMQLDQFSRKRKIRSAQLLIRKGSAGVASGLYRNIINIYFNLDLRYTLKIVHDVFDHCPPIDGPDAVLFSSCQNTA